MMENEHLLNEAQKNSLAVTLRLLEKRILMLELLMQHGRLDGRLYSFVKDIDEAEEQRLKGIFAAIKQLVSRLQKRFDLPKKTTLLSSNIIGFSNYFDTLLLDELSPKLARYGDVDKRCRQELDPIINELIITIKHLTTGEQNEQN